MTVVGASFDTPAENLAFAHAQSFGFPLLSDVDHAVGTAYLVTRDARDKFAGYPRRYSYLIDPQGIICKSYDVTDVADHADVVIADLQQLQHPT